MSRAALVLFLVFLFLALVRMVRPLLRAGRTGARRAAPRAIEAEMVRDPVCGTWIDRRLAVPGRHRGEAVAVCSEECRQRLESA